jgi:ribonuclease HI
MASKFIVEADGGSRGNPGVAGSGAVVLDASSGAVLIEIARFIGVATNNVAEYVAPVSRPHSIVTRTPKSSFAWTANS